MKSTLIALLMMLSAPLAQAEDASGRWKGRIANMLDVFIEFSQAPQGQWQGTISVPQQGARFKVEALAVSEAQIGFKLAALSVDYTARWNDADKAWVGTWRQGGQSTPLNLQRADATASTPKRPQEEAIAARTAQYTSSDVAFTNPAGGHTLAGTLSVPHGKGPFPAVVLVHGSGPVDRDEKVFEHKPFLVLADHLNRQGIAVLRYDKRGVGKSGGVYKGATSIDFAGDAEAAVGFLRGRPEVDHIGLVGHSEGGLIAPLVAARDPKIAFVVMLAGPGVRGELLMVEQLALGAKSRGMPDAMVASEREINRALLAALASEPQLEQGGAKARKALETLEAKGLLAAGSAAARVEPFATPWFHTFLRHEPGPVLQSLRQPVLALNGERDLQVPSAMDLAAIRSALKDNPRAVVKEMPGLNHLFQAAPTGAGFEYYTIEETVNPAALETVANWILANVQ